MGFLNKIFGGGNIASLKRKFSEIERNVQNEYEPLGKIGVAIITASNNCFNEVKVLVEGMDEEDKEKKSVFVFYEFIYFFMHMTMRSAYNKLNSRQTQKLQEFLGPIIAKTAVDTFFKNWQEDYKLRISSEFFNKLNEAELQYASSKIVYSKDNPFSRDAVFGKLCQNVSELAGNPMGASIMLAVLTISTKEFSEMKLEQLIASFANQIKI